MSIVGLLMGNANRGLHPHWPTGLYFWPVYPRSNFLLRNLEHLDLNLGLSMPSTATLNKSGKALLRQGELELGSVIWIWVVLDPLGQWAWLTHT